MLSLRTLLESSYSRLTLSKTFSYLTAPFWSSTLRAFVLISSSFSGSAVCENVLTSAEAVIFALTSSASVEILPAEFLSPLCSAFGAKVIVVPSTAMLISLFVFLESSVGNFTGISDATGHIQKLM